MTEYVLHGKNVVHLTRGADELHFYYDAQNKPAVVVFNGTAYGYLYNLQGDIVALVDGLGAKVVEYGYDAWGKPISKTGTMAGTLGTVQPFRYRGYVFDEETGDYYLRSRYYRAEWGRFLSADSIINGNLYAYCRNSPITCFDPSGEKHTTIDDVSTFTKAFPPNRIDIDDYLHDGYHEYYTLVEYKQVDVVLHEDETNALTHDTRLFEFVSAVPGIISDYAVGRVIGFILGGVGLVAMKEVLSKASWAVTFKQVHLINYADLHIMSGVYHRTIAIYKNESRENYVFVIYTLGPEGSRYTNNRGELGGIGDEDEFKRFNWQFYYEFRPFTTIP